MNRELFEKLMKSKTRTEQKKLLGYRGRISIRRDGLQPVRKKNGQNKVKTG